MIKLKGIRCLLKVAFNSGTVGYLKCNNLIFYGLLVNEINGNYISRLYFLPFEKNKAAQCRVLFESMNWREWKCYFCYYIWELFLFIGYLSERWCVEKQWVSWSALISRITAFHNDFANVVDKTSPKPPAKQTHLSLVD